jgi:uncharacterized membrane protein YhaH (DUF805 family)
LRAAGLWHRGQSADDHALFPQPQKKDAFPMNPSPFDEAMPLSQILFGLRGRIPRKTFWLYGVLALALVSIGLSLLLGIAGFDDGVSEGLPNLVILWPSIAIAVKRWHDRDKSGWWVLINLIPVVGFIWTLVENGFLRGTVGDNRFGPDLTGRL